MSQFYSGASCGPSGGSQYSSPQRSDQSMSDMRMPAATVDQKLQIKNGQVLKSGSQLLDSVEINKDGSLTLHVKVRNAPMNLDYGYVRPDGSYSTNLNQYGLKDSSSGTASSQGFQIQHRNNNDPEKSTTIAVTINPNEIKAFRVSLGNLTFKIDPKEIKAALDEKKKADDARAVTPPPRPQPPKLQQTQPTQPATQAPAEPAQASTKSPVEMTLNTAEGLLATLGVPIETPEERLLKTIDAIGARVNDNTVQFTPEQIKDALDVVPKLINEINQSLSGDTQKKAKSDVDEAENKLRDIDNKQKAQSQDASVTVDQSPVDGGSDVADDSTELPPGTSNDSGADSTELPPGASIDSGDDLADDSTELPPGTSNDFGDNLADDSIEVPPPSIVSRFKGDVNALIKFADAIEVDQAGTDLFSGAKGVMDAIDAHIGNKTLGELRKDYEDRITSAQLSFEDLIIRAVKESPNRGTKEVLTAVFGEKIADLTINTHKEKERGLFYNANYSRRIAHLEGLKDASPDELNTIQKLYDVLNKTSFKNAIIDLSAPGWLWQKARPDLKNEIFAKLPQ